MTATATMPQLSYAIVWLLALTCLNSLPAAVSLVGAESDPQQTTPLPRSRQHSGAQQTALHVRSGGYRQQQQQQQYLQHTTAGRPQTPAASLAHCEYKELMTNLHDRIGILATLDEDQRNRLQSIDKKVTELLDTNSARMESMKAQQMDFQQRLDSFEHIQRLSRSTLDELKELSRKTRAVASTHAQAELDETGYQSGIFSTNPMGGPAKGADATQARKNVADIELDVPDRLDALSTLLVATAHNVKTLQQSISKVVQNTNNLRRRLGEHQRRAGATLSSLETATGCQQSYAIVDGILKVQLTPESQSFYVACESDGWTVVLRRFNGNLNFERSWQDYKEGFGNLAGEFFMGLDKLHALTSSTVHELRIVLEDFDGNVTFADYNLFAIGSEKELYPLSLLGSYQAEQSTAGDSLSYHAGAKFTTLDSDNDNCVELGCNCALKHKGGWWYNNCATSNLHGRYHEEDHERAVDTGIFWDTFRGVRYSLRRIKMLIRPVVQDDA